MREDLISALPYSDVLDDVLSLIYDSLLIIYSAQFANKTEGEYVPFLAERARTLRGSRWAKHQSRNNPHLLDGTPRSETTGDDEEDQLIFASRLPRITRLCLEAAAHAQKPASASEFEISRNQGVRVPSPLAILVDALTVPKHPESYGYGFALARAILFRHFKIHPPAEYIPAGWEILSIPEIQDAIESFRVYSRHRDNIHNSKSNRAKSFLAHFLTLNGTFVLRFGTTGKESARGEIARNECLEFLKERAFLNTEGSSQFDSKYEFRIAPGLVDMPDTQEILNSLMGVPLPMGGAPTVFFGGLRRSHRNSVVMSVSGPAGTGKTSFALALAASLAPFGTHCFYCSFEEEAETLRRRALGVMPQYFRRTTLPSSDSTNWLTVLDLEASLERNLNEFASVYLTTLKRELFAATGKRVKGPNSIPAIAPLLVVIDSLTTTTQGTQLPDISSFVRELRELNCIVLILSAETIPQSSALEYLVDTVVSLAHEGTDSAKTKPFRLFQLRKSRLQMSRPGSHLLHLSGELGLRIAPQLPSILDSFHIHRTSLPDRHGVIDTLRPENSSLQQGRLIDLYPRSRILIHGHGSSGKSALSLKILTGKTLSFTDNRPPSLPFKRMRILVVSFLYPPEYYELCLKKIFRRNVTVSDRRDVHVIHLPPGFITPEDFIGRILLEVDRAHLEGWPYTGILLDGLHNTFLQFPSLQGNDMVWPTLYSLLSRQEVTIISTFTTFSKAQHSRQVPTYEDQELILRGQLPFLHVLVQGTDFYLQVEALEFRRFGRTFIITLDSALNQSLPDKGLLWDADKCQFEGFQPIKAGKQAEMNFSQNS